MSNAYCGRTASLTLNGGSALSAVYRVGFNSTGNEQDITAFGSGEFGDWLICGKEGELVVETYDYVGIGATTFAITAGGKTFTGSCEPKSFSNTTDAKGVATYRLTLSLTGALTAS